MSYVEDNPLPEEKFLFTGKISSAIFLRSLFALIFALLFFFIFSQGPKNVNPANGLLALVLFASTIIFLILASYLMIKAIVTISTSEFAVTNKRIMVKTGFLSRNTIEILLSKVESISVDQNVLGRMLNFGTIIITGTGGTSQRVRAIHEPVIIRKRLNQVLEKVNVHP
jgi:uncharacterized membrane protein YdbT with pleckstrin-like domain